MLSTLSIHHSANKSRTVLLTVVNVHTCLTTHCRQQWYNIMPVNIEYNIFKTEVFNLLQLRTSQTTPVRILNCFWFGLFNSLFYIDKYYQFSFSQFGKNVSLWIFFFMYCAVITPSVLHFCRQYVNDAFMHQ